MKFLLIVAALECAIVALVCLTKKAYSDLFGPSA